MNRYFRCSALLVWAAAVACSGSDGAASAHGDEAALADDRRPIPSPANKGKAPDPSPGWVHSIAQPPPALAPRALGVTELDEVPDSSWFTNRNTIRPLSPAEVQRGPGDHAPPHDDGQWTIVGTKSTGYAIGMRARDENGAEFVLKFDELGHDEVETGADVAVQRLLFAAGYNVPENEIVYLSRAALSVAADAKTEDDGKERALRAEDVDLLLVRAAREPDGRYRALASRFLPGTPVGGIEGSGVRPSDPNDAVPHQDRRDMRGLYSLAAWLNHTDVKPRNTLDVWTPDRDTPSRGHVVHYLLDFGKALGAMTRIDRRPEAGFAYHDQALLLERMHLGIRMPWEDLGPFPQLRGLGWIESSRFDPATWTPLHPWLPFRAADRFDRFWGARIVMSFTPQQIRAALVAARYTEPKTVEYLVRVLLERQRKVGEQFFRDVAPLANFQIHDGALCFDDLWVRHELGGDPATYSAEVGSWHQTAHADATGTSCFAGLPPGDSIVEIRVARPGQKLPATRVHVAVPPHGTPAVLAIERL